MLTKRKCKLRKYCFDDHEDLDTFGISGKYYLNGVQVKIRHLHEAAFKLKQATLVLVMRTQVLMKTAPI
jgi:hypothetical protein